MSSFWQGKRVLITGHTGFKGSWLSLWLQCEGAHVIGLSLDPPSDPNLFQLARIHDGMVSIHGDVRNLDQVRSAIDRHCPEIIFHLAAQALVRISYKMPSETFSTNVMGTVNVLEASRLFKDIRVVVNVTSDKCYENREWFWGYRENEPMGGRDPYSCSKGCAELVTSCYRKSYFSNGDNRILLASVRAGNVIGGGDWGADRLIPDIIKSLLNNQPAVIRYPKAIRPWQHVLEPLSGYLLLAQRMWQDGAVYADGWNFGPNGNGARSVAWIADELMRLWGRGASWVTDSGENPHEANFLRLDCSKAKSLLNWGPRLDIKTALKWIVEWYRAFQNGVDMRKVTESQIMEYDRLEIENE